MKLYAGVFFSLFLAACNFEQEVNLSKDALYDKVKGGWAGQILGCTYGGPTEFRYCGNRVPDTLNIPWGKNEVKKWFDGGGGLYDDVYVDYSFVETFEKCGLDAPVDSFAATFLAKDYPLCHSNQQSRYNLLHGISPKESGYWKYNPHANCLDFQIEADFAGIMCPGMPNSSTAICDKVGHMLAYGDGWYGGVYVAAMYALAYVSNDVEYIVTEALKTIPQETRFHACMMDVINWHKQYPDDWKKCWDLIEQKWAPNDIACPDGVETPFNIETYLNSSYIILGLLYGEGDFFKTVDVSTRAGQDSDCNPASAGGILGTMLGYSHIPEKFREPLALMQDVPFNNTVSFNKGTDLSFGHTLQMIERHGGKISDSTVVIRLQEPKPAKLEVSFDGIKLDKKVVVNQSVEQFPEIEFEGVGAVITGALQGKDVDEDYCAKLEVYFNDRLIETCDLPLKYNHRKHELFFNYDQPYGKYKISCKWINPVEGASIHVGNVITYTHDK